MHEMKEQKSTEQCAHLKQRLLRRVGESVSRSATKRVAKHRLLYVWRQRAEGLEDA